MQNRQRINKKYNRQKIGSDGYVINRKDKRKVEVEIPNYPIKIQNKTYILSIARDIIERNKGKQEIKESEEKYQTVFNNSATVTAVFEKNGIISMVNAQCEKLCGYSKEDIENKMKWIYFVIPEDLKKMKINHNIRRMTGEKDPTEYEFRILDKKGNIKGIFSKIGMIHNTKKP